MNPRPDTLAPHVPLPEFYGDDTTRARWVNDLFDASAPDYDRVSEMMGLGGGRWYRRDALLRAGLRPGMRVLDVATGTGLVAAAALQAGIEPGDLVGLDPSRGMLAQNQRRHRPGTVKLVQGRGEALPFPAASFDFVVMGYALRHVEDLGALFGEFRRVLVPGGHALVLEISQPESRLARTAQRFYMKHLVPTVARLWTRRPEPARMMAYYWATIEACVPPATILDGLTAAGFREARRTTAYLALSDYLAVSA